MFDGIPTSGQRAGMSILTRSIPALAVTATLGLCAAPALAHTAHHGDAGGKSKSTHHHAGKHGHQSSAKRTCGLDRAWLKAVARADLAEIATGTLAQEKGTAEGVKSLGAMLVTDHTAHLELVKALGGRLGVPIPDAPSPTQQWEASVLATFSGAAFDQQWIALQIAAHQVNIEKTQDEIADGCNRKVRQLAKMTLPTLQAHLAAAQQLAAATSTPGTGTGTGTGAGTGTGTGAGTGTGTGTDHSPDCHSSTGSHHGDDDGSSDDGHDAYGSGRHHHDSDGGDCCNDDSHSSSKV
jgi:predicted outer membrane protein